MKKTILAAVGLIGAIACSNELEYQNDGRTVLTLELPGTTKTVLGDAQEGVRPVLWCKGDKISVNGVVSAPLDVEGNVLKADFVLSGQVSAPYEIIYPAGMVKDAATITLPAEQNYAAGDNIVSGSMPMAGYSTTESVMMKQVCGILGIRLKMGTEANLIRYVEVAALGCEPVCGDFTVDYQNGTLSSEAKDANVIRMEVQKTLPAGSVNTFNVILPAGVYSAGFQVKVVDENGQAMVRSIKGNRELEAGKLMLMPELEFVPNSEDKGVEIATPEDWNSFATAYNAGKYPDSQIATITADLDFTSVSADKFVTLGLRDGAKQSPDGNAKKYFAGTLNGNGKRILNLKTDVPFIQAIGTGALVKDVIIDASCEFGVWYGTKSIEFGPLVGYCSDGKITNCSSSATVTLSQCNSLANNNDLYVGGLVGRNRAAEIIGCTSSTSIVADATYVVDAASKSNLYIGGFTGYCSNPNGVLEKCTNTGNISVASTALNIYVGGICARCSAGTVTQCTNSGSIETTMARAKKDPCKFLYLGGLFGVINTDKDNSPSIVNGCSNSGAITSRSNVKQLYIGGVAGLLDSPSTTLTDNTSSGNITTTKRLRNLYCGGLFGAVTQAIELNLNGEPYTGVIKIGTIESSTVSYLYCGGLIGQTTADVKVSGSATWKSSLSYVVNATNDDNIAAESFFGGICGCAYGASINLSGMKSEGTIAIDTLKHTISGVGGIIGGATKGTSISDCSNSSKVSVKKNNVKTNGGYSVHVGGIAGRIFGGEVIIKRCTNSARIESRHFNNNPWSSYNGNVAGGIVGSVGYSEGNNFPATIEECHNSGTVYSLRGASGGIAGYVSKGTITGCSFTGGITRSAPGGGIAGVANSSVISECYVKASIKTAGSTNADCGGIVGEAVSSTVDGCRYYGDLIPPANVSTGGIIGKADDASSAGVTTACGFGGKINGTTITEETNLSTYAIGSTTGTRGTFYLWNGVL